MNDRQLRIALERLRDVSPTDAERLRRMVADARALISEGYALQRAAWDFYRDRVRRT